MSRITVVVPPAEEPVSLPEAKAYLRIDHDADDAVISAMIAASRRYAEQWLARVFVTQTLEYALAGWPGASTGGYWNRSVREAGSGPGWLPGAACDAVALPRPPLQSVGTLEFLDDSGTWQTITEFQVGKGDPARLTPSINGAWPSPNAQAVESVRVTFVAGYGSAADVPPTIKAAILLWVAYLYENRGEESAEPPAAVAALLSTEDYGCYA